VLAALDARMQEVYWGAYRCAAGGLVEALGEETVSTPARVALPAGGRWSGAGSGWASYAQLLGPRCGISAGDIHARQQPHAGDVARLAAAVFERSGGVPVQEAIPVYLRDTVAAKPGTRG
jgi:tRNA threonylcarbamoyladenosine biosynthesis protein TsaB